MAAWYDAKFGKLPWVVPQSGGGGAAPFANARSVAFDGVDEKVSIGTATQSNRTVPFSFTAWIKAVGVFGFPAILGGTSGGGLLGKQFIVNTSTGKLSFQLIHSGSEYIDVRSTTTSISGMLNTWLHVGVVYTGSSTAAGVTLYVNSAAESVSIAKDTLGTDGTTPSGNSFLGHDPGNGSFFNGKIDEANYWNKALSLAEIQEIYNAGVPRSLTTHSAVANLVNWWRMGDSDTFPTLIDVVGGANGTMTNMESGDINTDVP